MATTLAAPLRGFHERLHAMREPNFTTDPSPSSSPSLRPRNFQVVGDFRAGERLGLLATTGRESTVVNSDLKNAYSADRIGRGKTHHSAGTMTRISSSTAGTMTSSIRQQVAAGAHGIGLGSGNFHQLIPEISRNPSPSSYANTPTYASGAAVATPDGHLTSPVASIGGATTPAIFVSDEVTPPPPHFQHAQQMSRGIGGPGHMIMGTSSVDTYPSARTYLYSNPIMPARQRVTMGELRRERGDPERLVNWMGRKRYAPTQETPQPHPETKHLTPSASNVYLERVPQPSLSGAYDHPFMDPHVASVAGERKMIQRSNVFAPGISLPELGTWPVHDQERSQARDEMLHDQLRSQLRNQVRDEMLRNQQNVLRGQDALRSYSGPNFEPQTHSLGYARANSEPGLRTQSRQPMPRSNSISDFYYPSAKRRKTTQATDLARIRFEQLQGVRHMPEGSLGSNTASHDASKPYRCFVPGCNESFKRRFGLKRHTKIHTGEKPFSCIFNCGKSFALKHALKRHLRTHTGERPYACNFPNCGKRFADGSNFRRHEAIHAAARRAMSTEEKGKSGRSDEKKGQGK